METQMSNLSGAGLMALLKAERGGLILLQKTGLAPTSGAGQIGSIALDTRSNIVYHKTDATTWVAFP
jgi:hypothetical protein